MSIDEVVNGAGRALVQPPRGRDISQSSTSRSRTPSVQYRESAHRQAEQDEARAVRVAMEKLELAGEEKLYDAARDEAAELVYKHRHPNAADNAPNAPYAYPGLRKKGTERSRSVEREEPDLQRKNSKLRKRHSMGSTTSGGSRSSSLQSNSGLNGSDSSTQGIEAPSRPGSKDSSKTGGKVSEISSTLKKAISDLPDFKHRRVSSGSRRKASGSLFSNPNDQIYEEPEEEVPLAPAPTPAVETPTPAKLPLGMRRNPFMRFQSIKGNPMVRSNTDPVMGNKRLDRYEIQKNPPSQSRNAGYTLNSSAAKPAVEKKDDAENEPEIKMKDGKEIRSEELRAATGFRLKDRSAKLPTPTMVSDSPGRPIVSFDKGYNEIEMKEDVYGVVDPTPHSSDQKAAVPRPLSTAVTASAVPTLKSLDEETASTPAASNPRTNLTKGQGTPAFRTLGTPLARANTAQPIIKVESQTQPSPYDLPPPAPIPKVNTFRAPPARTQSSPAPPIPTIAVSETPSISVNGPASRRQPPAAVSPPMPTISVSETPSPAGHSRSQPQVPQISVTPQVPVISVNASASPSRTPRINAPATSVTPSVPSINVHGSGGSTRPLPDPKNHVARPFGRGPANNSRVHWTPTNVRTGALCTQCALPIAGRIVSAGGSRFHPECFTCYQCGEHLECVAFYPEPDNKHAERAARIHARQRGEDIALLPNNDMARLEYEDGTDPSPRFFCHLDFHEIFSPRCKSCKTPIEGEVIVACGAEWHAGHFFCAQCGDPFDSSTPFVEKEGYAWCVNCHTHRFSTKCRKCRKPVVDTVVKALGAEWHVGCFCCVVSLTYFMFDCKCSQM